MTSIHSYDNNTIGLLKKKLIKELSCAKIKYSVRPWIQQCDYEHFLIIKGYSSVTVKEPSFTYK